MSNSGKNLVVKPIFEIKFQNKSSPVSVNETHESFPTVWWISNSVDVFSVWALPRLMNLYFIRIKGTFCFPYFSLELRYWYFSS